MLFADSMSLLWFSYYGLSLLVLLAVYFALSFLPRLPRLVMTWCVAGAMWMPANYRVPLVDEGSFYTGWAPSAMVAAVGFFEHSASAMRNGLLWAVLGVALGAGIGIALWWRRRPSAVEPTPRRQAEEEPQPTRRREPVIR
ncbi:MAG TPA: hypothetical protein DCX04_13495 [Halomonas sp.]|nr:hypothetical protein [Halomonas sp.]